MTDVGPVSGDVVVLTPIDGGTVGNSGPCVSGLRCVAFVSGAPQQGICQ